MTAHQSTSVAVIRTQDDMLRESAERFLERERRLSAEADAADVRHWIRATQDGWDWPLNRGDEQWPAPDLARLVREAAERIEGLPADYWRAMKALGEEA